MRVAFYARVSTDRQQHAQTIEQQVAQLHAYAAAQDSWWVQEEQIFRDDGYSGAKLNRPALDALRDQAARAAFEVVLITSPDRLARNYVHQMLLLEELERHGCQVCFIDRPPNHDPHEQLVLQIRGAVAEYERTLIADRMRRGRLAKLRRGELLPWTRPPYGYRLDPERPRDPATVRVEPAEAAIVAELFAAYAEGGVTLYALAQRLTDRNVPSPTGRRHWTASTIRGILTNPAYIGQTASGRRQVISPQRRYSALKPVGRGGHSSRPRPPEEWICVAVPAMIKEEEFAQVQQRLLSNQQQAMRSTQHEYLLRGLVSCGVCQLSCTGRQRSYGETRYRYYVCRGKQNPVGSCREERCPARFIPAEPLDQLVWEDLCQLLQEPARITQALERAQSGAWVPEELRRRQETLRGVRESLERQRERLLEAYLAEAIELSTFKGKDGELRQRQQDLWAQEREIEAQSQRREEISVLARSISEISQRLRAGLEEATFAQRRQLVELLIDRVVVTNGEVEIRYVIPTSEASLKTRFCHLRTDYFERVPVHRLSFGLEAPVFAQRPVPGETGNAGGAEERCFVLGRRVQPDFMGFLLHRFSVPR
jgi:site-specific DNA recombinase